MGSEVVRSSWPRPVDLPAEDQAMVRVDRLEKSLKDVVEKTPPAERSELLWALTRVAGAAAAALAATDGHSSLETILGLATYSLRATAQIRAKRRTATP